MKVRDVMTPNPRTAQLETTLEEIATMMKDEDVGMIPVLDDGEIAGVVSDRDIVVRCIADGKTPAECTAEDIMSEELRTIDPEAEVDEAADLMAEAQIRRLPVVKGGKLVGMLSLGDIAVKTGDEEDETTAETLQEVSRGVKQGGQKAQADEEVEEESEMEMAGSGKRNQPSGRSGRERNNWNQGDREAQRGGQDKRRVASAQSWEGGRGRGERGRVQQTGETRRVAERGRPEKVGHGEQGVSMRKAKQGATGVSNRAAGRQNARPSKVAPKRAEARGSRNAKRRRAS